MARAAWSKQTKRSAGGAHDPASISITLYTENENKKRLSQPESAKRGETLVCKTDVAKCADVLRGMRGENLNSSLDTYVVLDDKVDDLRAQTIEATLQCKDL